MAKLPRNIFVKTGQFYPDSESLPDRTSAGIYFFDRCVPSFRLEKIRCGYAANVFHLQGTPEFPLQNIEIKDVAVEKCDIVYASREHAGNTILSEITLPEK